ncbi:pseudouridine synthase [Phaeovulum sp.]|uniref:pseudouridine synthase n=1 Tax=Phaeovulum sp. TaxID=2934796 RepID=UPI0035691BE2
MPAEKPAPETSSLERIAKVMARAGIASRRDAEKMILEGRVAVNGTVIKSPALDVAPSDRVTLDGKPIDAPQETRLWLYYKPLGLVTSEKDEKGRQTVFDTMPAEMPRVMSVGRLDLNSEGLLLLTNDGGLKRRLELPETGWLRKYRARVNGRPDDSTFDPLRRGITIDGEEFLPMEIGLDRQQGANAWLTVGIREGRNREIRRAMEAIKLTVNRLIRVSYGPFRLNDMQPGDVVEVKRKIMREQLGERLLTGDESAPDKPLRRPREPVESSEKRPYLRKSPDGRPADAGADDAPRKPRARAAGFKSHAAGADSSDPARKAYTPREGGERKPYAPREGGERKPYAPREDGERKPYTPREGGERKPYAPREGGERKPYAPREGGERKPYAPREGGERKPYAPREGGERKPYTPREGGERKPYAPREGGERKPYAPREGGERKPYAPKGAAADKKPYGARSEGGERKSFGGKPRGAPGKAPFGGASTAGRGPAKPRAAGSKSHGGGAAGGGRASGFKSHSGAPGGKPPAGRGGPKPGRKPGPRDKS